MVAGIVNRRQNIVGDVGAVVHAAATVVTPFVADLGS
jgi:hypothetical protein